MSDLNWDSTPFPPIPRLVKASANHPANIKIQFELKIFFVDAASNMMQPFITSWAFTQRTSRSSFLYALP